MAYNTFSAIHVGSGEVMMKVYEMSKKNGIRQIDYLRYYIELGSDTYTKGYIDHSLVYELCNVLDGCRMKLEEYRTKSYLAYATGALTESSNCDLILDQIRIRTGLELQTISNARQRFFQLKSLSVSMPEFEKITQEGAVIADMGTGSLQLTVYEAGKLIFTQNLRLGSLRIREILSDVEGRSSNFSAVMDDYIGNDFDTLSFFFKNHTGLRHMVISGEELLFVMKIVNDSDDNKALKRNKFAGIYESINALSVDELSVKYSIPYEVANLLKPALAVYRGLIETAGTKRIWSSTSDLCDGMAWEFFEQNTGSKPVHDFTEDMISYSRVIAEKYRSNSRHTANVEYLALSIFDAVRKYAALTQEDGLLLRISCILHDSGKFVNMTNGTDNSYFIVLGTDFIGISEDEKKIAANVIKYNSWSHVPAIEELSMPLSKKAYIRMLKLTSILRLANAIDRSHRQKVDKVTVSVKEKKLLIRADTIYDITLEQNIVNDKGVFFEEVYGLMPQLRLKRR